MRRIAIFLGVLAFGMLGVATPAFASGGWGSTTCSQVPSPACDLGAGQGGSKPPPGGTAGTGGHRAGRRHSEKGGKTNPSPGDTIIGRTPNQASCSYVKSDYQPPSGGVVTAALAKPMNPDGATVQLVTFIRSSARAAIRAWPAAGPVPGQQGAWYVYKCTTGGDHDAVYRPPIWIPGSQPPRAAAQPPSPAELAQMAHQQLRLPTPSIAANPVGEQLVNLPTWMWLSSGWRPVSATATVPGVSVTATATPTSVTWSMGDGATVTCRDAGTPFPPGTDPKASSPDCGHTYQRSSASQAGQAFPVSATVHWTVTWAGAGHSGVFPDLITTGHAAFRVAESQALNNGGG